MKPNQQGNETKPTRKRNQTSKETKPNQQGNETKLARKQGKHGNLYQTYKYELEYLTSIETKQTGKQEGKKK
jgi:hypothetical protein